MWGVEGWYREDGDDTAYDEDDEDEDEGNDESEHERILLWHGQEVEPHTVHPLHLELVSKKT